ncbi:mycothiol synthase [Microbispora cellulosiformans]|uniref:Mycothiol acetyltransferase n=1 Tax=Microbispora cellulosiformans TaxID=2614688 RepID=A0A5J5KBH7_9ACTN|nr:mycothiol synthase [Microbispora cellulosiformans]KAA9381965.1 mycothiol synthase [Microbispora cellulosiformans]
MNVRVEITERLDDERITAVLALVEAAAEVDGVRPLNEHVMLQVRYGGVPGARAVLLHKDGDLAGFAHLDPPGDPGGPEEGPSGELVVRPALRGLGLGRRLLDAVLETSGGRIRLWAHGDLPAAARLAASAGLTRARSLWRMRRPLAEPLPTAPLPEGVRLRTFEPGRDEQAWLALNAQAFAAHPEQGSWTIDDLELREREPWFDPAGFFLAVRGDTPVGFHWTKVHRDGDGEDREPIGEVYVVGVGPGERGTGLGRALTLAGLAHLRGLGLARVTLYVDEENAAAVRLYESLGFTRWITDVMYRR